jgi:pimeloyl-ACP methyl ester carboxylesterase
VSDRTLVLIPGLLCDAAVWAEQLSALRRHAQVQIAEHRMCDSLGAMAQTIIVNAPPRFAMAGHSMGGRVALEVLRRVPERITALALLDTGCHALDAGAAGEAERQGRMTLLEMARREGMRAMALQWLQGMVHPDRRADRELVNNIADMIARRTADHFAAQVNALLTRPEAGPLLPNIQCPTLVLCGREDRWSAVLQHEEMAAAIPNARLAVVPYCGHMCTMEQPATLAQELCAWLGDSTTSAG